MNAIRQTALLNKRELENATPPSASWHTDYRDTAYIYIGGLPLDLSEGDVITIFSQFGNPTHLNLIRDKETGKSKGFGFLKYEDQRSCDLAVDNLGGADVLGRLLRVDHTRYKKKEGEDEDTWRIDRLEAEANGTGKRASDTESEGDGRRKKKKKKRKVLREERELSDMLAIKRDGGEEDPMREYLVREKREEIERAKEREKKYKHRYRHKHRDEEEDEEEQSRRHRHKHRRRDRSTSDKEGERRSHRGIDEPHHQRQRAYRDKDEHGERRRSRSAGDDNARRHRKERSTRSPAGSEECHRRRRRSGSPSPVF